MSQHQPGPRKKSLMHNLGEFFGHIAHGVTSDPTVQQTPPIPRDFDGCEPPPTPPGNVVRQQTLEQQVETPEGKLILRRTIIDEVRRADNHPETP